MNILVFGPNGSGKGTQGAIVQKKYNMPHIESGAIFRQNIGGGTELGKKAKEYMLDGFPRNKVQAETLAKALADAGIDLDYVIEIVLDREIAKLRITGRRLCVNDNNHPNHIAFDAIKPVEKDGKLVCRVCGGELKTRPDDQDDTAINKRHNIYYDDVTGTMAAVNYFKQLQGPKVISVDGTPSIQEVSEAIMKEFA